MMASVDALCQASTRTAPTRDDNVDYSKEENSRWQSEVLFDPSNDEAWLNFYKSKRLENYTERYRTQSATQQRDLDGILDLMTQNVSQSYGWHVAKYLHLGKSDASWVHLKEAAKLRPDDAQLFDDLIAMNAIEGNIAQVTFYAKKLADANVFSSAEMEYNKNVLRSLEKNAVLITNGFADTYPLFILQYHKGFRKDVKVLCLEWTGSQNFVQQMAAAASVNAQSLRTDTPYALLAQLQNRSGSAAPVYLSLTLPPDQLRPLSAQLYCTGLAMKISTASVTNLESLASNWEKLFDKKQLLAPEPLNRNYLVPLILLIDYYQSIGKTDKAGELRETAGKIASNSGQYRTIEPFLR